MEDGDVGAPESIGESKIWYLKKNRLFANATVDAVTGGAEIFTMELLPKRATFFDQGDVTKVVFLIKTGRVRISRNTADGKEVTVAILGPGDMFGEDALFGGIERTTVATCMEETLICKAHADDLFAPARRQLGARAQRRADAQRPAERRVGDDRGSRLREDQRPAGEPLRTARRRTRARRPPTARSSTCASRIKTSHRSSAARARP